MPILPVFPLNSVVFPGQRLPLHIFEERYRRLVREVMDQDGEFGIALIVRGREVGGNAEPAEVGCAVRITQAEELQDGRFNIACDGTRRFRILDLLGEDPYLRAQVEFLPDPNDAESKPAKELSAELAEQFSRHLQLVLALQNSWQRGFRFPRPPIALSDHVAGNIEIASRLKQEVLQADRVTRRLELLLRSLRAEDARLAEQVRLQRQQKLAGLGILN